MLKPVHQSDRHTHTGEREIYRQLQWRVAMATASLRLVSASPLSPSLCVSHSPLMSHPHVDKVSLTVAVATYCSCASLTPWCPSWRLYLNLISLAANDPIHTSYTHTSLYSASGDEDWQPLASWETECRCTDVPTHTHIRHKYTHQAGCHSWPVDSVSMDHLQGESFWHSDRQDRSPLGLQALSSCLRFPVSLSASGFVVFLPQQKFSMQGPNMARWVRFPASEFPCGMNSF